MWWCCGCYLFLSSLYPLDKLSGAYFQTILFLYFSIPPVPEPHAPAIKHANVNINEHNNVTTEMLLAFALNQLQIRNQHQDQNQDQNKNQQMVINSKRNQNHRPFDHEFQQLQERSEQQELETFEQLIPIFAILQNLGLER